MLINCRREWRPAESMIMSRITKLDKNEGANMTVKWSQKQNWTTKNTVNILFEGN